jgi:kojibiose phosphorylase
MNAMATLDPVVEQRTWQVVESPFNPGKLSHYETILTIGNGYLGLRGTFEEGYSGELVSTLAHGIYNHAEGELVPDLVNLPNPLPVVISVDGQEFRLKGGAGRLMGYRRVLDMQTATLTREVIWFNGESAIVKIRWERFASLDQPHVLAQRVSVRALMGNPTIHIRSFLDGTQTNEGTNHWAELDVTSRADALTAVGLTSQSGYRVAMHSLHHITPNAEVATTQSNLQPTVHYTLALAQDAEVVMTKITAIHSSRDSHNPVAAAAQTAQAAAERGYDALHADHCAAWAAYWHGSDVEIDGDEVAQKAVRFCTYHILIAAPRDDERVSIGAKTLSGPGYRGHVFWDTELFMVPMLTLTQPHLARNLLMYRYHNLQGARNKAAANGYKGAMFPWESTDTGEETTPQWTHPLPDGSRIRIWTGDNEQHISTDIAYAVMQYWQWTGDEAFFVQYGAEIVLDTAVFWGSRVEWVAERGRYELTNQIGPDEYHENVNNSAFTNRMVQWHLQTALHVRDWLLTHHQDAGAALLARLGINEITVAHWQDIIGHMYVPVDPETGIVEQFDGFFGLQKVDLTHWQPRVVNFDAIVGHANAQKMAVIKQADVVMLMALLGEAFGSPEQRRANWDYYLPLVDHGSSLSPSIHAWVAARLGLDHEAYKLFNYAANIDLEDLKGNVRDGIHAAACGGVWQALAFGFVGLQLDAFGSVTYAPRLPAHWRSVRFRVWHQGAQREIFLKNA